MPVVVVAPDKFRGSLGAAGVASALRRGLLNGRSDVVTRLAPVADGGEGTLEAAVAAGFISVPVTATGPGGGQVATRYARRGPTAVVEMADVSGLGRLPRSPTPEDALVSTSRGTGEVIKAALDAGCRQIVLGIGGSACTDGGAGMVQALGVRVTDADGMEVAPGGAALGRLAGVDTSGLTPALAHARIVVACDVDNPLTGPRGASAVYGPQKGATPEMVRVLDEALGRYARVARDATGRDVAGTPGAGAAGGLGAGLLFFTPARLRPGVEIVLEATGFDGLVRGADLVITGEGRTDFQSAMGKAPVGVAAAAKRHGVPVLCLSGGLGDGADDVLAKGIDALATVVPGPMALDDCMRQGALLVEAAAARICRLIQLGAKLNP
jgi:glycerate kinase